MAIETELKAPVLLIAVPQLADPNFYRGVVLVIEHGEEGSMGLLINRPTDVELGDFCNSQQMEFKGNRSGLVYNGGPVQKDRAFILHASEHQGPETELIVESTRMSYSLESLRSLAEDPPNRLRIFLGYAGWGAEQLAQEVTSGAWLTAPATEKLIFDIAFDQVWEAALRDLGIDPIQLMHSGAIH